MGKILLTFLIICVSIAALLLAGYFFFFHKTIGYRISGDKVYYYSVSYSTWKQLKREMPEAEAASFTAINATYGKDNYRAYYSGSPLAESDPATFQVLPGSFSMSRDARHLYIGSQLVSRDADHFVRLDMLHAKDRFQVYFLNKPIPGADAPSFRVVSGLHATGVDKSIAYSTGKALANSHGPTFEHLGSSFSRDQGQVYFASTIIQGADPASFELLNDRYAKDKSHVYYCSTKLAEANPATFIALPVEKNVYKGKDGNLLYKQDKKVDTNP